MLLPRERVLVSLRGEMPDRVPKDLKFTPLLLETFANKTGCQDPAEYFNLEIREVRFKPTRKINDFSAYYDTLPPLLNTEGWEIGEWGIGQQPGSMYHFVHCLHPMKRLTKLQELEAYPFPDITAEYRHTHLEKQTKGIQENGYATAGYMEWTIFEISWLMRGMENLFCDMATNKTLAGYLLDRVTEIRCVMAERFAQAGVDILKIGDDVGTQKGMLMSPASWREWLKPRMAEVIRSAKQIKTDILVSYHSDGNIKPIIPELIEIGVDVLNPVQPECMDPIKLKKQYGQKLSFWGTIGTQTTMPFGTPEEVKNTIRDIIRTVGKGGGLLVAPTHVLEPEVPWENVMAFVGAVNEFGRY